jgi:tRNA modification GTPase
MSVNKHTLNIKSNHNWFSCQNMDFIHSPYQSGETIAAIATPLGDGGISIIRISGKSAIEVADRIFSGPVSSYQSHTAHLGTVRDAQGRRVDEALLLVMRAPKSYTGEDTVELQCHGGMIASRKVLEACILAGARAAMPGEFTFKAYINGKIDLAQAEAVQKLIGAKNEQAFAAATHHLEGALSKKIKKFQTALIRIAAILEAWVDFPEEGLEFDTHKEISGAIASILHDMQHLAATFHDGKRLEKGISLCIAGPPNAGKSSLMNAFLDQERAIVAPIAGTTRDLLHEELTIGGLHFRLTDTAGIRETEEYVEQEGIRRSKEALMHADLVLLVLDATRKLGEEERRLFEMLPHDKTVALWNKMDLPDAADSELPFRYQLKISARERTGLDQLKQTINNMIWMHGVPPKDEVVITTARHQEALNSAMSHLELVLSGLHKAVSPEFLTSDLRCSLNELGKMLGLNVGEEILNSIFSQFCIGK